MNVYKINASNKIIYAVFDNVSPSDEWAELLEDGTTVPSGKTVVKAADGSLHFSDEISPEELESIAKAFQQSELWNSLRAGRNTRIAATDYMLLPDVGLSEDKRAKVLAYRQALRDLPAQAGAPWDGGPNVPWPVLEQ